MTALDRIKQGLKPGFVLDALGLALALAYAWPTTLYRFGRDQALYYYIGREWWLHGSMPYRDAFDFKPPAIYFLHGFAVALFGQGQTTIRVLDVFAVLTTGVLAGLLVQQRLPKTQGVLGAAAMLASAWYFSNFDFWHSAQVEIWEGLFLVAAYLCLERARPTRKFIALAGVFCGLSALFKFTAALPIAGLGLLAMVNGWRIPDASAGRKARIQQALLGGVVFSAGTLLLPLLVAGYFALRGAFPALVEMLRFVSHYANDARWNKASDLIDGFWLRQSGWWLALFVAAWLLSCVRSVRNKDYRSLFGALFAMVLLLLSAASVVLQRKFFFYHWGVITGFFVLVGLYGLIPTHANRLTVQPALLAFALTLGSFFTAAPWQQNRDMNHRKLVLDVWMPRKKLTPQQLMQPYVGESSYSYESQNQISSMIRDRARPGDMLHVRGFELAMYAITGLRTPARFVSELPFDDTSWATEKQEAWRRQQHDALWSKMPRFFVTFHDRPGDIDLIKSHQYAEIGRAGVFVLFEHQQQAVVPSPLPNAPAPALPQGSQSTDTPAGKAVHGT